MELPDVQGESGAGRFKLTRVGVRGVKKPIEVCRPERTVPLVLTIDAFVDLPSKLRGVHMSRNIESVNEVLDMDVRCEVASIEALAEIMVKDLLDRHDYATRAEVALEGDYFLERESPSGKRCLEVYRLFSRATLERDSQVKKMIGAEVIGMSACPCGMETVKEIAKQRLGIDPPDVYITHNQRNIARLFLDVPEGSEVEADDLIDILEESVSAPTRMILKRLDEAEVILRAHQNPKFVEDIVRDILALILERYSDLPDEASVIVQSESVESIHKHSAFAERCTTLGELRK